VPWVFSPDFIILSVQVQNYGEASGKAIAENGWHCIIVAQRYVTYRRLESAATSTSHRNGQP